jgi:hypothetical protein
MTIEVISQEITTSTRYTVEPFVIETQMGYRARIDTVVHEVSGSYDNITFKGYAIKKNGERHSTATHTWHSMMDLHAQIVIEDEFRAQIKENS